MFYGRPLSQFYPLAEVATRITWAAKRTVEKWHNPGLRGGAIRLRAEFIGGRLCTCDEWVQEFLEALNADPKHEPVPRRRTSGNRQRASEAAEREYRRSAAKAKEKVRHG
jgi:hypothetical protein